MRSIGKSMLVGVLVSLLLVDPASACRFGLFRRRCCRPCYSYCYSAPPCSAQGAAKPPAGPANGYGAGGAKHAPPSGGHVVPTPKPADAVPKQPEPKQPEPKQPEPKLPDEPKVPDEPKAPAEPKTPAEPEPKPDDTNIFDTDKPNEPAKPAEPKKKPADEKVFDTDAKPADGDEKPKAGDAQAGDRETTEEKPKANDAVEKLFDDPAPTEPAPKNATKTAVEEKSEPEAAPKVDDSKAVDKAADEPAEKLFDESDEKDKAAAPEPAIKKPAPAAKDSAEPASAKSDKSAASGPPKDRLWTDDTGFYQVKARLAQIVDGKVRLLKDTGRYTTVPMHRLSKADLEYVSTQSRALASH